MKKIWTFIAGLALVACSPKSPKDNPTLVEANRIHIEAEAIQEEIEPEIEKIDSLKNELLAKKNTKTDSLAYELTQLKTDFEEWEKNFFAVPGFEYEHKTEHEHHHHNHATAPELPADKMLEVQKEIRKNIEGIKISLDQTMPEVKEVLK
ncbi:hypothetical protein [Emticicia agri]|uniref:Lipoprotein n=1 Tax=Emticicia agri TaxID=2492393 RepID=A0A4Q5LUH6_9BACT|nr:hypothetical protein [Emticicia agri]RYU93328.1 hypothetical protein EWM59_22735 [Emticicia agri]